MGHQINLNKYQIRTDLAIEAIDNSIITKVEQIEQIKVTEIDIDKESAKKIGKKEGKYFTIEFEDITDYESKEKVKQVFSDTLTKLINILNISKEASCLVVGLGNERSTPDALGPLTINNVIATAHLFVLGNIEEGFRKVMAFSPSVTGKTGIETSDIIISVAKKIKPDFIIVIDALASQAISRVNKTIQMTDTGIHPGSGVGNSRKEISNKTLGIPVIAIGVPTVVDAVTIVGDTINYIYKHYFFTKQFEKNPLSKLTTNNINYLNKETIDNPHERANLLGLIGTLNDNDLRQLLFEVLSPIGYNLMVTPKEVDFIIEKLSDVIGNGINRTLHPQIKNM